MIKTKLRIAQGSIAPYFAALLALITVAAYFIDCGVNMTQYRLAFVLPMEKATLLQNVAWMLQMGAMVLLFILLIVAAKRFLALLALPVTLYALGTVLLVLDNNNKYYYLLIGALVFFYFFVLMVLNIMHSKVPTLVVEFVVLVGVAALCVFEQSPFVLQEPAMGTVLDISVLIQTVGYYLTMLTVTLALTKKFVTDLPEEKPDSKDAVKAEKAESDEANWSLFQRPLETSEEEDSLFTAPEEGTEVPEEVETVAAEEPFSVSDWLDQQEAEGADKQPEPAVTVPVSGSRLQKSLKEEIVYDRDQKLMYKKKVNIFSVLGLVLSVAAIALGCIGIFGLLNIAVLQNESFNLMLLALGLCMLCMFGTRVTYKEYYTKTVVTERKVVREESNWEEFIANRLEEDERSIASLTESYSKMTEMYGRLLETTAELSGNIKALRMNQDAVAAIGVDEAMAEVEELQEEYEQTTVVESADAQAEQEQYTQPEWTLENRFGVTYEDDMPNEEDVPEETAFAEEALMATEAPYEGEASEDGSEEEYAEESYEEELSEEEVYEESVETFAEEPTAPGEWYLSEADSFEEAMDSEEMPNVETYEEVPQDEGGEQDTAEATEEEANNEIILPTFRGFGYEDMDLAEAEAEPDDELFMNKRYQMKPFSSRRSSAYYETDDDDDMPKMEIPDSVKAKLYDVLVEDEAAEAAMAEADAEVENFESVAMPMVEESELPVAEDVVEEPELPASEELPMAEEPVDEIVEAVEEITEPVDEEPSLPDQAEDDEVSVQSTPVTQEEERRRKLQEKLDMIYKRNQEQKRVKEEYKDLEEDIIIIR